jgi:hypothetical protein
MKYTIELTSDSKGLQPAIDSLEEIGKIDKANAEQFKKTNEQLVKTNAAVDELSKGFKEASQAATGAFGGKAIEGAAKQAESFRTQLRQSRDELVRMMQAGEVNTSQLYKMAKGAGNLKDQVSDAQKVISVLASDTFKLDAALQGIQVGAAGFQIMQGAAAAFGSENKDLQKALVQLNGVMAITQGLQQIQNALQKESALSLGIQVAAQKAYNFVVGESEGVLKVFRIALASTGIGLAVIALAALVANWDKVKGAISGVNSELAKNVEISKQRTAEAERQLDLFDAEAKRLKLIGTIEAEIIRIRQIKIKQALDEADKAKKLQDTVVDQTVKSYGKLQGFKAIGGPVGFIASLFFADDEDVKKAIDSQKELEDKSTKLQGQYYDAQLELQKIYLDDRAEKLKQEIELWRAAANELDNNSIERFNIEVNIANNEKKIALLNAKTLSEKLKAEEDFNEKVLALRKNLRQEIEKINSVGLQAEIGSEEWYKKQITYWEDLLTKLQIGSAAYINIRDEIKKLNDELERLKNPLADLNKVPQGKTVADEIKERVDKEKAIAEATINIAKETADTIFSILNQQRNAEFDAKITKLEKERDNELKNKELSENQKARINERYEKKIAEQKRKQAEENKKAAIAQAVINGALAITNILATMNWATFGVAQAIAIASTVAATAAQIATISAQKIPQFAKGTEFVSGAGTETSDSIPAMLSKGERVVPAHINKMLKGIPNDMLPEMLMPSKTLIGEGMDYDKLAKAFSKELASNPQLMVNFDKRGFETFLKNGNTTSQVKNSRNDF